MRRIAIGLTLAVGSIFLVGCGASDDGVDPPTPVRDGTTVNQNKYTEFEGVYGKAEKFTLDGTTCIVYAGDRQGGITCDWNGDSE